MYEMLSAPEPGRADRVMAAVFQMKKIDLRELERIYAVTQPA
jgi:hypothetical protein